MNFVTVQFVLFFIPVLCLGWLLRGHERAYRWFLIAASLVFYACAGLQFVPLLLAVAVLNWGTLRLMQAWPRWRRGVIAVDVTLHVLLLAFFKYAEFLTSAVVEAAGLAGWNAEFLYSEALAEWAFPVGLSFFTFQGLSMAIDHYRDAAKPAVCLRDVLAYVSFFPTIMAGPIMREQQFMEQACGCGERQGAFAEGSCLILSGLLKKVVFASYLSVHVVDPVFGAAETYSTPAVWLAMYAYAVQIYCDFSGYTDLALGVGRFMGFRLPENFNRPYLALNLQDFWRRWHISLSTWLRDYLYFSMGGSRRGNRYVNLIVTMLIGGMWHGCGIKFIVWGGMHGVGLAVVHAFHLLRKRLGWEPATGTRGVLGKAAAWLVTFHAVALLWVFFRADSWDTACAFVQHLEDWGHEGETFAALAPAAVAGGMLLQVVGTYAFSFFVRLQGRLPWYVQGLATGLVACLLLNMGPDGVLPFIYFGF